MNMSDLKPAREFAVNFGVKAVVYGGPGGGKTPICINTSPRPVVLMSEPGFLTMKQSTVPTFPAFTTAKLKEFFDWFFLSAETKNFDTLVWDSASQGAEIVIDELQSGKSKGGNKVHGQQAYGEMATIVMDYINKLYFMPQKHVVLINKQEIIELNGMQYRRPYMPGRVLPLRLPHLFDLVTNLGLHSVPGAVAPVRCFRTKEDFGQMGRDRSGNLEEFEAPDMGALITKCMK